VSAASAPGQRAAGALSVVLAAALLTCAPVGTTLRAQQTAAPADPTTADPALVRVTSSFDVTHAGAVLRQVGKLFHSGFVRKDADSVARDILALPAEQTRLWSFSIVYQGSGYPLQIRARLDDFGMLDLDFFSAPVVAGPLRGAVDGYLNSHRL
jgi:hypothetical protein